MVDWNKMQLNEINFWRDNKQFNDPSFTNEFILFCRRTFPFHKGEKRLEIAVGPYNAFHIQDITLIGADTLINDYRKYVPDSDKYCTGVACDARNMLFKDKEFTIIYCLNFLNHAIEINKCVDEMYRVCADDGVIYFYLDLDNSDNLHLPVSEEDVMYIKSKFKNNNLKVIDSIHARGKAIYGELRK